MVVLLVLVVGATVVDVDVVVGATVVVVAAAVVATSPSASPELPQAESTTASAANAAMVRAAPWPVCMLLHPCITFIMSGIHRFRGRAA